MTRHELRDLRWTLRSVAGEVAATGVAAVIADDNTDVAVIVSLSDYERLRAEH
ncbi:MULTISPECIES: type II toxin-antitoxin system Phd/YefM family antitoxin [Mycobacteriaceae]|uniref:type II toxin-antitoxin system Phd/YefM family antitoxin n=1 Tax=Mycobacteriaceae TaxID=1762 RepID=UPI0002682486|nr:MULTISPECIES: type II toxin-antitoxin system Phd/YefM family antitoxin [Mycobacteriaceae]EIU51634.1 phd_YefM family protein [Mycobacteroides abscessus 6G-0125-S]EIU64247.1 phd_YefM family protein [Mycobacteroides abscessus 6G-0728-S]EIU74726.1 phd_YefM family protein [Mycobacteroides abscessus 6G-1108]EIV03111.1 antitoxin, type II toxin-antitoxin system family protein [Mycobacteroides abscessus 6G-0728-R]